MAAPKTQCEGCAAKSKPKNCRTGLGEGTDAERQSRQRKHQRVEPTIGRREHDGQKNDNPDCDQDSQNEPRRNVANLGPYPPSFAEKPGEIGNPCGKGQNCTDGVGEKLPRIHDRALTDQAKG